MPSLHDALYYLFTIFLFIAPLNFGYEVTCKDDNECTTKLNLISSSCIDGKCTNPFQTGCLRAIAEEYGDGRFSSDKYIRECNSDDESSDLESQNCVRGPLRYDEVRIGVGNWKTSILFSWILQIFLSEVLDVPVTLESGASNSTSFYAINGGFDYSDVSYDIGALKEADRVGGDCTTTNNKCAHVLSEVWSGPLEEIKKGQDEGYLLPEEASGMVGELGLFVPLHTAKKDWSLTSFYGLSNNRKKMAETFGRPTSWLEYCTKVANVNCTQGDKFAKRHPDTQDEKTSYFVEGQFTGYFQKDDCSKNPGNCTGYFVNALCEWSTFAESQMHWNNISLISTGSGGNHNGYTYSEIVEIYRASIATKQDTMIWWFSPNTLNFGAESSPYRVRLPQPSQGCLQSRPRDTCSVNLDERLGNSQGSCDYEINQLNKIISRGLLTATLDKEKVDRSPALDYLKQIQVPSMAMEEIIRQWRKMSPRQSITLDTSLNAFTARRAVCEWMYDHFDHINRYVPDSFPRVVVDSSERDLYSTMLSKTALALAIISLVITVVVAVYTFFQRKHKVMKYAKVEFLMFTLIGFSLVAISSLLTAIKPTVITCIMQPWTITLGYTLQTLPILLKVAVVNKVTRESLKMKFVKFQMKRLKVGVSSAVAIVTVYLMVWTIVDPWTKQEYKTLNEQNAMVTISHSCSSESSAWKIVEFVWELLLLITLLILSLQSQPMISEFEESRALPVMVCVHLLFILLRIALSWPRIELLFAQCIQSKITSLLLSGDTILCIIIYFGEKVWSIHMNQRDRYSASMVSRMSTLSRFQQKEGMFVTSKGTTVTGLKGTFKNRPMSKRRNSIMREMQYRNPDGNGAVSMVDLNGLSSDSEVENNSFYGLRKEWKQKEEKGKSFNSPRNLSGGDDSDSEEKEEIK